MGLAYCKGHKPLLWQTIYMIPNLGKPGCLTVQDGCCLLLDHTADITGHSIIEINDILSFTKHIRQASPMVTRNIDDLNKRLVRRRSHKFLRKVTCITKSILFGKCTFEKEVSGGDMIGCQPFSRRLWSSLVRVKLFF